jgi:hypothetical protein
MVLLLALLAERKAIWAARQAAAVLPMVVLVRRAARLSWAAAVAALEEGRPQFRGTLPAVLAVSLAQRLLMLQRSEPPA